MALFTKDTARVVAEAHPELGALKDDVASALAQDLEYRLRELVQEARKFMEHSKRTRLTTEDFNAALKLRDFETLYGYSFHEPMRFVKTAQKDVFVPEEREVELEAIAFASLPPAPVDVALQTHWLAIDGIQPDIPQNPSVREATEDDVTKPRELIQSGPVALTETGEAKPEAAAEAGKVAAPKHVLNLEFQTYFNKITEAVSKSESNPAYFNAAMEALATNSGIAQLVPYFARHVGKEITAHLQHGPMLASLLKMVEQLLRNTHIHADLYLHQFLPAVLTCLLGKKLCSEGGDHFALRDTAAHLTANICLTFGKQYEDVPARITKTLIDCFLDAQKPLASHYGAVRAVLALGPRACQMLLVPHIKEYTRLLQPKLSAKNAEVRHEAERVLAVLKESAGTFLQHALDTYKTLADKGVKAVPELDAPPKEEDQVDAMDIDGGEGDKGSKAEKESEERPQKRLKVDKTRKMSVMKELALEELGRIGERYKEFRGIFGEEALQPYVQNAPAQLFTSSNA